MLFKNKSFYFLVVFLAIGFLVGFYFANFLNKNNKGAIDSQIGEFHAGGHKLINPLYECSTGEKFGSEKLTELEATVQDYVDSVLAKNSTVRASVYFRDLNNGSWFGVNEQDDFAPSSLLKLPIMMAYLKQAEENPQLLSKKVLYDKDPANLISQNFKPEVSLEKGKYYTIEQLIERMIESSDNVSLLILENNISQADIDRVTIDLGIPTATTTTASNYMNVRQYSTLFRVLYNSTYLNEAYSEKALSILSKSEFKNGLVGGIPKQILVAHKFGERHFQDGTDQLHDCGIIYYPDRPYLLCVMSKGPDFNDLSETIKQISNKVYTEFHKMHP